MEEYTVPLDENIFKVIRVNIDSVDLDERENLHTLYHRVLLIDGILPVRHGKLRRIQQGEETHIRSLEELLTGVINVVSYLFDNMKLRVKQLKENLATTQDDKERVYLRDEIRRAEDFVKKTQSRSTYALRNAMVEVLRPLLREEDIATLPRPITDEEIEEVVGVLDKIQHYDDTVTDNIHRQLIDFQRELLKGKIIVPETLPQVKNTAVNFYKASIVSAGEAVGIRAAEAIGQPLTQSALNNKNVTSTAKNVSSGLDALRILLYLTKNRNNLSCTIHFKDKFMTFEDIFFAMRRKITESKIASFVTDYEISAPSALDRGSWDTLSRKILRVDLKDEDTPFVFRLKLDPNHMYMQGVTVGEIVKIIEGVKAEKVRKVVTCLHTSSAGVINELTGEREVIIDVYPDPDKVMAVINKKPEFSRMDKSNTAKIFHIFCLNILRPIILSMYIKGIPGIEEIFPVKETVWTAVQSTVRSYAGVNISQIEMRTWKVFYDEYNVETKGITRDNIINLCRQAEMDIIGETEEYVEVVVPNDMEPGKLIEHYIGVNNEDERKYEQEMTQNKKALVSRPDALVKQTLAGRVTLAATYHYADTNGSNLEELFTVEEVDPYHTYSNDIHLTRRILGIEAARNLLLDQFTEAIGFNASSPSINPRHLMLMVDFQTDLGEPQGVGFETIVSHDPGIITAATSERAVATISSHAAMGDLSPARGSSTRVALGQRIPGPDIRKTHPEDVAEVEKLLSEQGLVDLKDLEKEIEGESSLTQQESRARIFGSVAPPSPLRPSVSVSNEPPTSVGPVRREPRSPPVVSRFTEEAARMPVVTQSVPSVEVHERELPLVSLSVPVVEEKEKEKEPRLPAVSLIRSSPKVMTPVSAAKKPAPVKLRSELPKISLRRQ